MMKCYEFCDNATSTLCGTNLSTLVGEQALKFVEPVIQRSEVLVVEVLGKPLHLRFVVIPRKVLVKGVK